MKCKIKSGTSKTVTDMSINGRMMMRGICDECGCKKCQFIKHSMVEIVESDSSDSSEIIGEGIVEDIAKLQTKVVQKGFGIVSI